MPAPQHTERLHGLDHLRTLAILLVFVFHYHIPIFGHPEWLDTYAKFGWTGVDLFFVLSGFLISSQLFAELKARSDISLKGFFTRRFFRILPAYWVMVMLYFCLPVIHEREMLPPLWKFLTFTQNLGLDIATEGTFSHAWSLCVEEHFYLLLPLSLLLLRRKSWLYKNGVWLIAGILASGIVLRHYCYTHYFLPWANEREGGIRWYRYIYYPSYTRPDGLLSGMAIAALYHYRPGTWATLAKYGNVLLVAALAVLTGAYYVCYYEHSYAASIWGFTIVAAGYGLLVAAAISPSCFLYRIRMRGTAIIATLSYGIYLSHKAVIHCTQAILEHYGADRDSTLTLLVCILTCIAVAALLYAVVEKPFMALRRNLSPASPKERVRSNEGFGT